MSDVETTPMAPPSAQMPRFQRLSPLALIREFTGNFDTTFDTIKFDEKAQGFYFNDIFMSQWEPVGFQDLQGELYNLGSIWYFCKTLQAAEGFKEMTSGEMEKKGFRPIDMLQREELFQFLTKRASTSQWIVSQEEMPLVICPADDSGTPVKPKLLPGSDEFDTATSEKKAMTCFRELKVTPHVHRNMSSLQRYSYVLQFTVAGRTVITGQDEETYMPTPEKKRTRECEENIAKISRDSQLIANNWMNMKRSDKHVARQWEKRRKLAVGGSLLERIKEKGKKPIILVPSNPRSTINLTNVEHLLIGGEYHSYNPEAWTSRNRKMEITRKIGGRDVTFRIVDSTHKFTKDDWHCVVACIVDGKEWQFKGWPFENYGALFKTMAGIHICLDDDPNDEYAKKWNVLCMQLRRVSRHEDGALVRKFWNYVEDFATKAQKRELNFDAKLKPGAKA